KIKGGMVVGILAVIISAFFITLYLPIGASSLAPVEWGIFFAWTLLGVVLYLFSLRNIKKNKSACEAVMFGNPEQSN
ncbi:MAG: hypothetical protein IJZ81_02225, partial [Clostridia bacterium]|nr:hypothetical protein [Clostridia bacterium]